MQRGDGTGRPSSPPFPPVIFPCSRFLNLRGPNYLGAWNRVALLLNPLSSADAPSGYPPQNSNNKKTKSAQGTRDKGKGKKRPLFSLSPSHRSLRAFFFFLPSLPTTQKGLCGREGRELKGGLQSNALFVLYVSTFPFKISSNVIRF